MFPASGFESERAVGKSQTLRKKGTVPECMEVRPTSIQMAFECLLKLPTEDQPLSYVLRKYKVH